MQAQRLPHLLASVGEIPGVGRALGVALAAVADQPQVAQAGEQRGMRGVLGPGVDGRVAGGDGLAAFALGLTLFVVTLILNVIALRVVKRYREAYE